MSIERSWEGQKRIYIPTCDICGAQLYEQHDFQDAVRIERQAGWKSKKIDGEWTDLCPECQLIVRKEE